MYVNKLKQPISKGAYLHSATEKTEASEWEESFQSGSLATEAILTLFFNTKHAG